MTPNDCIRFFMMVGIPGSGKTTWISRNLGKHVMVVHTDSIRRNIYGYFPQELEDQLENKVWNTAVKDVRSYLFDGFDAVLDSMALSINFRSLLIHRIFGENKSKVNIIAVFLDTPFEVALKRNKEREKVVNEDTIIRLLKYLEPPTKEEGFYLIIRAS